MTRMSLGSHNHLAVSLAPPRLYFTGLKTLRALSSMPTPLFVRKRGAMGVEVGGSIDVVWPSGDSATIEVVGVFSEGTLGNWVTSLYQIPLGSTTGARDGFVLVLLDRSSTEAEGRSAVASVLESYPTAQAQWRSDLEAGLVAD